MLRFLTVTVLVMLTTGGLGAVEPAEQVHRIAVTDRGFEPAQVRVAPGRPVRLVFRRESQNTCATSVQMPGVTKRPVPLPLKQDVAVRFTPREAGRLRFGCAMDMMVRGEVIVGTASSGVPSSEHESEGCGHCGH